MKTIKLCALSLMALMTLGSCEDDINEAENEETLDVPFRFTVDYKDSIQVAYDLSAPLSDWLSMVRDETRVCKLSIPGTHDTMTGMGFYQPVLKYVFNITAISQVSTLQEQMDCGIRFFDLRPVVSIDTLATQPSEKQILRMAHGISEIDVTLEQTIDWMQQFLREHPSEFIIVKIQADNGLENQSRWTVLLDKVLSKPKYDGLFLHDWRPDVSVGELRGKIMWLSRFDLRPFVASFDYPIAYCEWPDEDPDVNEELDPVAQRNCAIYNIRDTMQRATLYAQDYYKADSERRLALKQRTVIDMLRSAREATATDENIWIVNHCSAYTEVSPRGYITNAANLHPMVIADLQANEGTVGIVPVDMACHDYVHCIINGGTPYLSDYLYGFHPLTQSLTNLLVMSNRKHFR